MSIKHSAFGAYDVKCPKCKEEFETSAYPTYCIFCGEELEPKKKVAAPHSGKGG